MSVLLDECVDRRLASSFQTLNNKTVSEMGWTGISNGKLLALAEKEFSVFRTVDRNLSFQQSVSLFDISIVVMRAKSNRLVDLQPLAPKIIEIIPTLKRSEVVWVDL